MVTDRYQHIHHHPTVEDFIQWADNQSCTVIGIDNIPGSEAIETSLMPKNCVLVFGQEGPGLSEKMIKASAKILAITQYGSTRSINAGVASGVAMYEWLRQHSQV